MSDSGEFEAVSTPSRTPLQCWQGAGDGVSVLTLTAKKCQMSKILTFQVHPVFRTLLLWKARCTLSAPACLYCFGKCRPERKNNCDGPRRIPLAFCFYSVQNHLGIFAPRT
jgi:hypothetical protein